MSIIEAIESINPRGAALIIAVDGYGGSGKSTFAQLLATQIQATVVHTDDFAQPNLPGWDYARFHEQVIVPLKEGRDGLYQRYDWDTDKLADWQTVPKDKPLIIEGVSALRDELGNYWDYAIYIKCPYIVRLQRGVERDGESMRKQWTDVWMPEEEKYYQSQRPDKKANLVIDGTKPFKL